MSGTVYTFKTPSMAGEVIGPGKARPTAVDFAVVIVVNSLLSNCLLHICVFIPQCILLLPWNSGFSLDFLSMSVKEF